LPSHQSTDHIIELKPETKLSYMQTYNMSPAELKTLKNYLNDTLAKKWIHESQNSAKVPVIFILKKSEELCLCVNYQALNAIIIKNQYFLSLISELLDHLNDFLIFSKIDLKNVYHCIQIQNRDEWKTVFHI